MRLLGTLIFAAWALALSAGAATVKAPDASKLPAPVKGPVDFVRDVQPIFASKCFSCHGTEQQKGGLRLDLKAEALAGGDDGRVVIPGKSIESKLVHVVGGLEPDKRMPKKGEPLTPREIGVLRAWIDAGAVWPDQAAGNRGKKIDHWAFKTPVRPSPPAVKNAAWVRNPIDAFVVARLEKEGISPAPEADKFTLIRRLSLDLIGLPPTPEEVRAFVRDESPRAYEALVERLLASPHFGERWARHWLDVARYADSDGYEKDTARPFAYLYRDWVIRAINSDLPFDQFTIQQIAGDLLPKASVEQKLATGFQRQTLTNKEGGVDQEEFRCKAVVDRVNTLGAVWLGVTISCAECHSHKYDPFSQREFYQLYAFFNDASERDVAATDMREQARYETAKRAWDAEAARLKAEAAAFVKDVVPARQAKWEAELRGALAAWRILDPGKLTSARGAILKTRPDKSIEVTGPNPATETYTVEVSGELRAISGFRLEVLPDAARKNAVGRSKSGNFVLSRFAVRLVPKSGASQNLAIKRAVADFEQGKHHLAARALDGDRDTGWAVAPQTGQSHAAVFELGENLDVPAGAKLVFVLEQSLGTEHTIAHFRLSATSSPRPLRADTIPDAIAVILQTPAARRTPVQAAQLTAYFRDEFDPDYRKITARIEAHSAAMPKVTEVKAAVLLADEKGRRTQIHVRGDFLRKGDEVTPDTPGVLPPLKARGAKPDRLDLAQWLVDPANPLTGRVTANHFWKHLFGKPLVKTENDFGTRGELPSHPALLDWLATEFPRLGWSRKAFIKLIVTSATYRQSSAGRTELVSRDPSNELLARQNRFRLEAESVRDAYLAVSGLLAPEVGGPSVRPPLPADIAALGYANSVKWKESAGTDKYRRGLYIFFQRTVPYPMLMTFDAPDSNVTCTRRERSNTPLQALSLLNDPVFFESVQAFGRRAAQQTAATDEKIRRAFTRALAREPEADELARLMQFYRDQVRLISDVPASAAKILGEATVRPDEAVERAAMVAVSRVILNLDEFVTRD